MPITNILERNAKLFGNEISLVEINPEIREKHGANWREYELVEGKPGEKYRRQMTWAEFDEKANRFANLLLSRGLGKGKKVAILLMNCLEWLPIYFGVLKAGAVAIPMNYRYTADEIKYCLDLADADALIFGFEFIDRVTNICDNIPRVQDIFYVGEDVPAFAESYDGLVDFFAAEPPKVILTDADDAAIYFSSGTTGFPKAILHNHDSLVCACEVEQAHHGQTRSDCFLLIPPLYHTGAKMHWFGSLLSGSRAVILRGVKPEWIVKAVSEEQCTIVWLTVPWAQDVLYAIDRGEIDLKNYKLDQWRMLHIGAQPVPPSLVKHWLSYFPNHQYDTNYGLSESIGPGCVHLGVENINKVGAIGVPGYGWKVMIADTEGNPVNRGDVGELCVKGRGVMTCYYNDPQATAESLRDGWLLTGDMAMEDEDGFIYLVDRKKDVIIMGGENLYPVQIEDFIRENDKVADVAVIGMPDERLGEIAAAIIQLKPGVECTVEEIDRFCARLPRYKRPRKVIFDEIPRNPTGKIEKPKLRERYGVTRLVEAQNKR